MLRTSLLVMLLFSSSVFANDIFENPILTKVKLVGGSEMKPNITALLDELHKDQGLLWIGWPHKPNSLCTSKYCYAGVIFASESILNFGKLRSLAAQNELGVDFVFDNSPGTYSGKTAIVFGKDDSFHYCKRYEDELSKSTTWVEAYLEYENELTDLTTSPQKSQRSWLSERFNCGASWDSIARVEIVLDLATRPNCPLDSHTNRTCFLGRGFRKFVLTP